MRSRKNKGFLLKYLLFFCYIVSVGFCKNPETKPLLKVSFCDFHPEQNIRQAGIFVSVLQEVFDVVLDNENYDVIFCSVWGRHDTKDLRPSAIKIFWTEEAMPARLNGYDFSSSFDYIDDPKYFRLPVYYFWAHSLPFDWLNTKYKRKKSDKNKKFAAFLVSFSSQNMRGYPYEGTTLRVKFFNKFSEYKRVDSGGKLLNNIGYVVSKEDTVNWLSNYKFVIAFENKKSHGYITEKLYQAYLAGAVPIYYGDDEGIKDINKKAIIYAGDFASIEELAEYVKKVDNDPVLYESIWKEPLIIDERKSYTYVRNEFRKRLFKVLKDRGKLPKNVDFN